MFKLFHKKLNKKGFTLAELLVVVAIIAVLVAIAILIFTGALRDAQLRVNQANIRSLKGEAVAAILSNWSKKDDRASGGTLISSGVGDTNSGWVARAKVSKTGDVTGLKLYVMANGANAQKLSGVTTKDLTDSNPTDLTAEDGVTGTLEASPAGKLETVAIPEGGYTVQVFISKEEYKGK